MKTKSFHKYVQELAELTQSVQITDQGGQVVETGAALERAIGLIQDCAASNGKLIFIGNGGSAAIASHQAVDYWKNGGIRAIAFNDASLLTCISNDFGYRHVFEKPIEMFGAAGDVLMAISSSGKSENILRAVQAARFAGCCVLTFSGFSAENPLRRTGDLNFYIPAGAYGYVEIAHLILCHMVLDFIIERSSEGKA